MDNISTSPELFAARLAPKQRKNIRHRDSSIAENEYRQRGGAGDGGADDEVVG